MDEDGFVTIIERLKDMIISGGENIYPAEVEHVIAAHPSVVSCAVIGLSDQRWGERVHAVVVRRSDVESGELRRDLEARCRDLIARYKWPESWDIRGDPLPPNHLCNVNN